LVLAEVGSSPTRTTIVVAMAMEWYSWWCRRVVLYLFRLEIVECRTVFYVWITVAAVVVDLGRSVHAPDWPFVLELYFCFVKGVDETIFVTFVCYSKVCKFAQVRLWSHKQINKQNKKNIFYSAHCANDFPKKLKIDGLHNDLFWQKNFRFNHTQSITVWFTWASFFYSIGSEKHWLVNLLGCQYGKEKWRQPKTIGINTCCVCVFNLGFTISFLSISGHKYLLKHLQMTNIYCAFFNIWFLIEQIILSPLL
jgi:hypothetical protein